MGSCKTLEKTYTCVYMFGCVQQIQQCRLHGMCGDEREEGLKEKKKVREGVLQEEASEQEEKGRGGLLWRGCCWYSLQEEGCL